MWGNPVALCQPPVHGCGCLMEAEFSPTATHQNPAYMTPRGLPIFLIVVFLSRNGQMTSSDSWIVWGNLQSIVCLIIVL